MAVQTHAGQKSSQRKRLANHGAQRANPVAPVDEDADTPDPAWLPEPLDEFGADDVVRELGFDDRHVDD